MSTKKQDLLQQGFTFVELLVTSVVLVVFVALAAFVLRPANYGVQERNAERWLGVAQISQALKSYYKDHGSFPGDMPTEPTAIGSEDGEVDACGSLVPRYFRQIPLDPSEGGEVSTGDCSSSDAVYTTGYTIMQRADGAVVIAAPAAEGGQTISVATIYE